MGDALQGINRFCNFLQAFLWNMGRSERACLTQRAMVNQRSYPPYEPVLF
jgi:hypothetical protein